MDKFARAAALLAHLDPESRALALARLPDAHRQRIELLLAAPPEVDRRTLTSIVAEYQRHLGGPAEEPASPMVAEPPPAESPAPARTTTQPPAPSPAGITLDREITPGEIAVLLQQEQPWTTAAVLSHLSDTLARPVFESFDERQRAEIAAAMAGHTGLSAFVLDELQTYLSEKLHLPESDSQAGIHVLARLLDWNDRRLDPVVLGKLSERDRRLLSRLRGPAAPPDAP